MAWKTWRSGPLPWEISVSAVIAVLIAEWAAFRGYVSHGSLGSAFWLTVIVGFILCLPLALIARLK